MIYYLMHKDLKVLKMDINIDGHINRVMEVYDVNHMPYSTSRGINNKDFALFKRWWEDRSIPLSRNEYKNVLDTLDEKPLSLVLKAHGLSLNDQYWIKKEDESYVYDDISFFSNNFSDDIGDILVGKYKNSENLDYYSPDSTSTGDLKKRWKNINGKTVMLKAGTKPYQYEVFNEIIASKIMSILSIDHVEYSFYKDDSGIYCLSDNFILYNEEYVTAYQLYNSKKISNSISLFNHLLDVYKELNIDNYKSCINEMLFVDYIMGNTDRHLNNFGVIRNAKTLEFKRMAPIYDTGSSLGYNLTDSELLNKTNIDWKPFKTKNIKSQLELIDDYSWLKIDALKRIPKEVDDLLKEYEEYISFQRKSAIISFIVNRINNVLTYLNIDEMVNYSSYIELPALEKKVYSIFKDMKIIYDLDYLSKKCNASYITIYRTISKLVCKGLIVRKGSRKTGYWEIT